MHKNEYDLSFWVNGNYSEEKAQEVFNQVKDKLIDLGTSVIFEKISELKKLAYEITYLRKHYTNGYFATIIFKLEDSNIKNIKKTLDEMFKYSEDVIRYLVIENEVNKRVFKKPLEEKEKEVKEGEEIEEKEVVDEEKEEVIEEVKESEEVAEEKKEEKSEISDEQLDDKIEEALK